MRADRTTMNERQISIYFSSFVLPIPTLRLGVLGVRGLDEGKEGS